MAGASPVLPAPPVQRWSCPGPGSALGLVLGLGLVLVLSLVLPWAWFCTEPGSALGLVLHWAWSWSCCITGPVPTLVLPQLWSCPRSGPVPSLVLPWFWSCPGPGPASGLVLFHLYSCFISGPAPSPVLPWAWSSSISVPAPSLLLPRARSCPKSAPAAQADCRDSASSSPSLACSFFPALSAPAAKASLAARAGFCLASRIITSLASLFRPWVMMCEAEKAQPGLQVLGTVTTEAGNALPWVHVSQCDLGILEAGAGPGLSRVKLPVWGF